MALEAAGSNPVTHPICTGGRMVRQQIATLFQCRFESDPVLQGRVAQRLERVADNDDAEGSIPSMPTIKRT